VPIDFASADMAARSDISPARWRRPFWIWFDDIEAGWAIPLLKRLCAFTQQRRDNRSQSSTLSLADGIRGSLRSAGATRII
jgi:hypothetical protein